MRYLPLIAGVLLICAPAKADKFWLSDPAKQNAAAGSSPDLIEGVLVAEDDETYHVRIEGGEIVLSKKSVFKVEKDGLTLDAIVKAEGDKKQALEQANKDRAVAQAEAQRQHRVRVVEASARRSARAVDAGTSRSQVSPAPGQRFDPVVGVVSGAASDATLMRDAKAMWDLTRNRSYLRQLRQLRRMR